MRHTFGFVLGVLLTPALIYGAAWSYARAAGSFDPVAREITDATHLYGAMALMAAVGLVVGVLVVARWASPLLSLIPALTLLGWSAFFLVDPGRALELPGELPSRGLLDDTADAGLRMLLGSGAFALLGFVLLVPAGTPRRWSGRHDDFDDEEYDGEPAGRRQPEYF
ncbi:hypothetical protein [Thermomonospora cellulosilytica]|uniref:Uncharacterized protein n=1 Tax=Thermomonospora cellulosilytica TaxID=1411118 RepID=A0A7W3RA52_9ACTN|nr:hypothetical protein [Thermomonospora cellulosilytica]MBA9005477.1 hypothetical protein [Thermomonospora cellulosilytica]